MKKQLLSALIAFLLLLTLCVFSACDAGTGAPAGNSTGNSIDVTLNGDQISLSDQSAAAVSGSELTITKGGIYTLSGTLNNGKVIVQADKTQNVTLILNSAELSCADSAPIFIKSCKNCYIELAAGTENKVTDGKTYVYPTETDTEPSAAIFSKADLIIQGTGALTVEGNFNNAIASKDDLEIKGGNLTITAANNGLKGKDSVVIKDGIVKVDAVGDAIKSDEDADPTKGFIQIDGGDLTLKAGDEGLQAVTNVTVNGGTIKIVADSDGIKADTAIYIRHGDVDVTCASDGMDAPSVSGSATVNGTEVSY